MKLVIKRISASLDFVASAASGSRENWPLATLALSPYWPSEIFLISWSYRSYSQMCMMCFMYPNFAVVSKILFMESIMRIWISRKISLIASILSVSWMKLKGRLGTRLPSSSKFNGRTIPRKKQLGKESLVFVRSIPTSFRNLRISGRDSCKGGRIVTAQRLNPENLFKFSTFASFASWHTCILALNCNC